MKPGTRLLIRFTLPNGDMKGWGYDYPHYKTGQELYQAITSDFSEWPENTDISLFYHQSDKQAQAEDAEQLADIAVNWLSSFGVFNGN